MMAEDRKNRRTNDRDAGEHNNMPENILLKRRAQNEKVVACGCKWFRLLLAAPRPQRPHLFFGDYRVALRRAGAVAMAWPVAKAMQVAISTCVHTRTQTCVSVRLSLIHVATANRNHVNNTSNSFPMGKLVRPSVICRIQEDTRGEYKRRMRHYLVVDEERDGGRRQASLFLGKNEGS